MIKSIGEMRTRVTIQRIKAELDREGFNTREYEKLFKGQVWCKWEWERGTETFENERQRLEERAKLTMRYSDKVGARCVVLRENDEEPWDVISTNDVDEKHRWLELTLKRSVKA